MIRIIILYYLQVTNDLPANKLIQLTEKIPPQYIRTIAIKYLDLEPHIIDNFEFSRQGDPSGFKFDVLYNWSCRSGNDRKVIICRVFVSYVINQFSVQSQSLLLQTTTLCFSL